MAYQDIPIPLGHLDQKTDERLLAPPGLKRCDNAIFDELGGFQKRPGHSSMALTIASGGSITAARLRALGTRASELVLFAQGKAYSWADGVAKWADRGRCESVLVDQRTVSHERTDQVLADRCETTNASIGTLIIVTAWEDRKNNQVKYIAEDKATGALLGSATVAAAQRPRCILMGRYILVFYHDTTASEIRADVIDSNDVPGTIGVSPQTIATDEVGHYDLTVYSSAVGSEVGVIAYANSAIQYTLKKFDSTGAVTATSAKARACDVGIAIDYHATVDRFSVARLAAGGGAAGRDIFHDWIKGDLTDDATVNTLVVNEGAAFLIPNLTTVVLTGQTAYVLWDLRVTTPSNPGSPEMDTVFRASVTSGGVVTEKVLVRRSRLGSKAVRYSDDTAERFLVHVFHSSDLQSCYALMDVAYTVGDRNGSESAGDEVGIVGRLFPGEGPSSHDTRNSNWSGAGALTGGLYRQGHLPTFQDLGSNKLGCALAFRKFTDVTKVPGSKQKTYFERGVREVIYTVLDSRAYTGAECGKALYLPGAMVQAYDGNRVAEAGFLLYPEDVTVVVSDTGGSMGSAAAPNGKYYYRIYWEWRNAQGEIERSTHAGNVTADMSALAGSDNSVTLTIPTLPYTAKSNVYCVIYRTTLDGSGPFYRVVSYDPLSSSPNPVTLNDTNANTITYIDTMADATLTSQDVDYLSNGEIDNVAPPATPWVATGQSRLFTRDPEDKTLIHYSKLRFEGDAVAGSDVLTIQSPQDGGPVNGAIVTEGALLVFATYATYIVAGQGLTNTAGPPDYASPQRVEDLGCVEPRSLCRSPAGIFFQSKKGMYAVATHGGQVEYLGAQVEDDLPGSTTVYGCVHVPDKHQVRVYGTNGIFVYDYLARRWSKWTITGFRHAVLWGDKPVYVTATAVMRPFVSGDGNNWLDAGTSYSMDIETGAIALKGLGGRVKVRRVTLTLKQAGTHTLRVRTYRNDGTEQDNRTFNLGAGGAITRVRVGCKEPSRMASFRVRVTDEQWAPTTLASSFDLSGLDVNVQGQEGLRLSGASGSGSITG